MPVDNAGFLEPGHQEDDCPEESPLARHQARPRTSHLIPTADLLPADSLRSAGESEEHVRVLLESATALPPIIVHRPTMRVVDGMHRLRVALARGQEFTEVEFFDGAVEDAFVLAVEANTRHGLPLSHADRKAAAERVMEACPHRSDRWIALVSGLSPNTVSAIRRRSTGRDAQSNDRVGRDGRTRPVDSTAARRLAAELMAADPGSSLRDIAKRAGIAPSTALDVRNRLSKGMDVVPTRGEFRPQQAVPERDRRGRSKADPNMDLSIVLENLRRDPSLRFSEAGRTLIRWLDVHSVDPNTIVPPEVVPRHCLTTVAAVARHNARFWESFGDVLGSLARELAESDGGA